MSFQVESWDEALAIENSNPYGNAACIYTTVGSHAQYFQYKYVVVSAQPCLGPPPFVNDIAVADAGSSRPLASVSSLTGPDPHVTLQPASDFLPACRTSFPLLSCRFRAAMIGVNIGIPVPREPFSFGGLYGTQSKYGDMDITGDGCLEFFTNRRKITAKWPAPVVPRAGASSVQPGLDASDRANFDGKM